MTEQPNQESPHHLEQQRRANRDAIAGLGVDPYGQRTTGVVTIAAARRAYDPAADAARREAEDRKKKGELAELPADPRPVVTVAGRIVLKRDGGKLMWFQVRDYTSGPDAAADAPALPAGGNPLIEPACAVKDLQIAVSKADVAEPGFEVAKNVDMGDVVVVTGRLMKTKTGEVTVWASRLALACKSLTPPPEKWQGLTDVEIRYRRRYTDLWSNPETMRAFVLRSKLAGVIRRFLDARGFLEVETPVLQTLAGGAAARPFVTHINALDIDLFMRIAPELYLKRLLVGGMPRVFEWSRNFRNEGIDKTHNPEFTIIELYEAFGDYNTMRELTESLFRECAREVSRHQAIEPSSHHGPDTLVLPYDTLMIDYARPFEVITYEGLFEKALGHSMHDKERVLASAQARKLPIKNKQGIALDHMLLVNELFDEAEAALDPARPTFVIDYPAALCPLTRPKPGRPEVAERFELFIGGFEMANAYTELNDPDIQEAKFREQLAGVDDEESTFRNFDQDFIDALKVGMPPAGGLGIGLERLLMVVMNQRTIRDVLLFPLMRPVE
jgi:lysyl-tRNA synthetase class 2